MIGNTVTNRLEVMVEELLQDIEGRCIAEFTYCDPHMSMKQYNQAKAKIQKRFTMKHGGEGREVYSRSPYHKSAYRQEMEELNAQSKVGKVELDFRTSTVTQGFFRKKEIPYFAIVYKI